MKYYKIIENKTFIGVIHSGQFIKVNSKGNLRYTNELGGQYVEYKNKLYRDYWMIPITSNLSFTLAQITEITLSEYNSLKEAIDKNEEIIIDDETENEVIPDEPISEEPDITVEFMRTSKLQEMSYTCRTTIEAGLDLELRGAIHHFSLDTQDQLNLISLSAMAQTQELIPYHADGEVCIFYTAEEINSIVAAATQFKIYHTTYYNALKTYINALETIEEISTITYGTPIPEEYKSDVLRALEQ